MKKTTICLTGMLAGLLFLTPSPASPAEVKKVKLDDPKWLLEMCQDPASMEKKIARYISQVHKIQARNHFAKNNENDLYLSYGLAPSGAPKIWAIVNARALRRQPKTNKVTGRLIQIDATYALPAGAKTDLNLQKIRKLNDEFLWRFWSPFRVYLTPRKNIRLSSFIAFSGTFYKLHPEMVYSLLVNMVKSWGLYYKMLVKAVPEAARAPKTATVK